VLEIIDPIGPDRIRAVSLSVKLYIL
jgi:hypothetical protein